MTENIGLVLGNGEREVEFEWALSRALHFSRNQKDENKLDPFAITKSSSLPTTIALEINI